MLLGMHIDGIVASSHADCDALVGFRRPIPTINLEELTYYTSCVFQRDWKRTALEINQTASIDQLVDRFNGSIDKACSRVLVCQSQGTARLE